ncbi:MAG TPA: C4-type zinc ribbon domain-containing protein [Phycisphaerae bacterium]|nr:C4-type zinc ribbon domain-containing protein [Phycisphaerae bacterium]HOJ75668.1 C4-type zinc ribbon domain-containing protein [Phycisphaerae bacterium]HOM52536.1 C4-type zinc ribbon domain-containing protein [Phycisphaerae bacterium]HON66412.1 C4-type zinc ribbon domain-containing protein [Phycisphaerae bacterium]HPP27810.1 C4-type zinc ribbon domain-containing protein [Phycisphaerae bacterium]
MGATLDALFRLQKIENQLRSVRGQIESKNRRVTAQLRRINTLEQQLEENRQTIARAQADANNLELQRKTHEAHITKLREALNQAKSNKEYAAILTQLNTDKADALKLEDRVLAGLAKVDELKKKADEIQAQLEKESARLAELKKDVADQEAQLADELKSLEAQREQAAEAVGPENLHAFERACERHEGEAMSAVERVHPRRAEYICTGCHMSVPLERINALQTRDEVQLCPNCLRILCLDAPSGATV